jgi:hypothetical protein
MARRFLTELANLRDGDAAAERFEMRFERFQRSSGSGLQTFIVDIADCIDDASLIGKQTIDSRHHDLFTMRDELRLIWTTGDLKTKEWRIFLFRVDPHTSVDVLSAMAPPPPNAFHQAVMYLFKWAAKTRLCRNPNCSSPFFLARRKTEKYCNEDCALPAQRASKRDWWRKHGDEWRRKRRAARHRNSSSAREGIPKTTKPNA